MLKKCLVKKKFSVKLIFTKDLNNVKNLLYFSAENEINTCQSYTSITKLKPTLVEDLLNKHYIKGYNNKNKSIYSERIIYVNTPTSDYKKLKAAVCNSTRELMKLDLEEANVMFSPNLDYIHRQKILNYIYLTNYVSHLKTDTVIENIIENNKPLKQIKQLNVIQDYQMEHSNNLDKLNYWAKLAESCLYTRELANVRPNIADCDFFERISRELVGNLSSIGKDVTIEVIKGKELLKENMNLLYSVGMSAQSEPRAIILRYNGNNASQVVEHAVIGKGLTFDTGGLNLKPTNYIEDMYIDKHGACNSLGVFKFAAELGLKINLVCALAVAENSIDSASYKPSDIITSRKVFLYNFREFPSKLLIQMQKED